MHAQVTSSNSFLLKSELLILACLIKNFNLGPSAKHCFSFFISILSIIEPLAEELCWAEYTSQIVSALTAIGIAMQVNKDNNIFLVYYQKL